MLLKHCRELERMRSPGGCAGERLFATGGMLGMVHVLLAHLPLSGLPAHPPVAPCLCLCRHSQTTRP